MAVTHIEVSNFKSFKHMAVSLDDLNVIIGPNAGGKSNFVQIFKLLRDITTVGLDNAISLQGGVDFLINLSMGRSEPLCISATSNVPYRHYYGPRKKPVIQDVFETVYTAKLSFSATDRPPEIIEDTLTQRCRFLREQRAGGRVTEQEQIGPGTVTISHIKEAVTPSLELPPNMPVSERQIRAHLVPPYIHEFFKPGQLLIEAAHFPFAAPPIFGGIAVYDFDPSLARNAVPITGRADLDENAANLAVVLKNVLENPNRARKLSNLVTDLLPFVEDIRVEGFADKSLLIKVTEQYFNLPLPAFLLSHGTITITALIIALYFQNCSSVVIEEPERSIHPYLVSRVMNMMSDAAHSRQVVMTTHNPITVRHVPDRSVLLVSRGSDGFSTITRPSDEEHIRDFLKQEMGLDELFVDNLLTV